MLNKADRVLSAERYVSESITGMLVHDDNKESNRESSMYAWFFMISSPQWGSAAIALGKGMKYLLIVVMLLPTLLFAKESECFGTTDNGRLKNGVQLPMSGHNFVGYSTLARIAGRTYVHSRVRSIMLSSYKSLETELPDKVFKYAETGFEEGGRFKPHKTHSNGLSVDFMVPVLDQHGVSVHLPTNPLNRFGYDIEFNENSEFGLLTIDYEAMAAHIVALHKEAKRQGVDIWRVIFDPKLQPNLFKTQYGAYLRSHLEFSKRPSWVRHDEHYHVDFQIPCQPL